MVLKVFIQSQSELANNGPFQNAARHQAFLRVVKQFHVLQNEGDLRAAPGEFCTRPACRGLSQAGILWRGGQIPQGPASPHKSKTVSDPTYISRPSLQARRLRRPSFAKSPLPWTTSGARPA